MFEKGNKLGKGRPKGSTNRSTEMMKVNLARAVNMGLDYLKEDYQKLRDEDPAKALNILTKLMEYSIPKLKSVDMEVKGEITNKVEKITIEIKNGNSSTIFLKFKNNIIKKNTVFLQIGITTQNTISLHQAKKKVK